MTPDQPVTAQAADDDAGPIEQAVQRVRPRLRGWFHVGAFPVAVIGGLVLVVLAPTVSMRFACAVFALTGMLLFGTSAVYHRGSWSVTVKAHLRRWDHSNIFLIIAGTYTPVAVMLLPPTQMVWLLSIVWAGALIGVVFRVFWTSAPRWLYVPCYIAMGVAGVGYMGYIFDASVPVGILIIVGGVFYIGGAVVYGLKRPDPVPHVFGFHEIFHACTIVGYGSHFAGLVVAAVTMWDPAV
ncbi:PAQR family membrane homeostasis protein TrhA [Sediminivirga luteola]|uniref:DNA-binding protein n=1 Tax=Sediminivirga luteola TaxID=1774748 RepID=A0A8J2TWT7_9MICO|nr:hemolysin III family protein [Sediminivirga luteola]MCI2267034.1 hemolysin III family protein [Sediminivirga luteola]GGA09422.1 DNA-binding protein [Sediminivirga luteola]